MSVGSAVKKVGKVFAKIWDVIQAIVPDEQLVEAIRLVEAMAERQITSAEKREWVVNRLAGKFGISESVARLLTEIAFQHFKRGLKAGEKKLEDAVKNDNEPPQD